MPADPQPADPRRRQPASPPSVRPPEVRWGAPPLGPGPPAPEGGGRGDHGMLAVEITFAASAQGAGAIRNGLAEVADDVIRRGLGRLVEALPAVSTQPGWHPGIQQVRLRWVRVPEPEAWTAGAKVLLMLESVWDHLGLQAPQSVQISVRPHGEAGAA